MGEEADSVWVTDWISMNGRVGYGYRTSPVELNCNESAVVVVVGKDLEA